jgi:hypothetical protein
LVDSIVLDRYFRVWRYGVGHSQLLLHARAGDADLEHLNVLFEDVRAVKLRSSYQPLTLRPADDPIRTEILTFADVPARHQHRYLTLTLPSPSGEAGFILCARATVLAVAKTHPPASDAFWPTGPE